MPEQQEQKQETVGEAVAAMRRYADILAAAPADPLAQDIARLLREYADRVERASKREMDEAAEFINDYLQEIPVSRKPHDWLVRNGYTDTSYQNAVFAEEKGGGAE